MVAAALVGVTVCALVGYPSTVWLLDNTLLNEERNYFFAMIELPRRIREHAALADPSANQTLAQTSLSMGRLPLHDANGARVDVLADAKTDVVVFVSSGRLCSPPFSQLKRHPHAGGVAVVLHANGFAFTLNPGLIGKIRSSTDLSWLLLQRLSWYRLATSEEPDRRSGDLEVSARGIDGSAVPDTTLQWRRVGDALWIGPYNDERGSFFLPGLPASGVELCVSAPGCTERLVTTFLKSGSDHGTLDIQLEPLSGG